MLTEFGLIGNKLSHSFSKNYFEEKFRTLGLKDHHYYLFEIQSAQDVNSILKQHPHMKGLNVTIPFKKDVINLLDDIEGNAERIGSVNAIKVSKDGKLNGYNTDYYGFRTSVESWIDLKQFDQSALVLGSGGASQAVCCVLEDLKIPFTIVSRTAHEGYLTYEDLGSHSSYVSTNMLIINTTPLGMFPALNTCPSIDYSQISSKHYVYDLVYNPEQTLFLKKSQEQGAKTKNGLEMLHLQAEKSWEIWSE